MKKKKTIISIITACFIVLQCMFGVACDGKDKVKAKVDTINFLCYWFPPEIRPDLGYVNANVDEVNAAFKQIKDCGMDVVVFNEWQNGRIGSEVSNKYLELCEANGLKVSLHLRNNYIDDGGMQGDGELYETDFSQSKYLDNIYYIAMGDEPPYDGIATFAEYIPKFEEHFNVPFFINLFPTYMSSDLLSGHTYAEYVEHYCNTILKKLKGERWLSVDHYPYLGGVASDQTGMTPTYLENLETMRYAVKDLDNAHLNLDIMTCSMTDRRLPELGDIRQQVYVGLLYGVEQFTVYTYGFPRGNPYHVDGTMAMVDESTGEPTQIYYDVQTVIGEIKQFEDVYLSYEYNGTKTFLAGVSYSQTHKNAAFRYLKHQVQSFDEVDSVFATQDTVVSEFFNDDGDKAYLMVNYADPLQKKYDDVTVKFKEAKQVDVIIKGVTKTVDVVNGCIQIRLEPGEGCMFIPR